MKHKPDVDKSHLFKWKAAYLLLAISLLFSCTGDDECKDIDYGRQYMLDSTKASFAYKGGETLIFKDSIGQELNFEIIHSGVIYPTWLNLAQDVTKGICAGEIKIRSSLQLLVVNFISDTMDYKIIYEHRVHSRIEGEMPIYYDIMSSDMSQGAESPVNWHISTKHVLDPRGNEDYFTNIPISYSFEEFISLNGKYFEKVYFNTLPDGSALYFNHAFGFVGFKEGTKSLWVLDRIE